MWLRSSPCTRTPAASVLCVVTSLLIIPLVHLLQILKWVITRKRLNVQWRVATETQVSDHSSFSFFVLRYADKLSQTLFHSPVQQVGKLETEIGFYFFEQGWNNQFGVVHLNFSCAPSLWKLKGWQQSSLLVTQSFFGNWNVSPTEAFLVTELSYSMFTLWWWWTKSVMSINEPRSDHLGQFHYIIAWCWYDMEYCPRFNIL